MISSVKIVLRKKAHSNGLFPLAIRISKNNRSSYKYLGHYISLSQWNEKSKIVRKSHPNSDQLNKLITKKLGEVNNKLLELQSNNNDISSSQIKNKINNSLKFSSFFDVSSDYLKELEDDKKLSRLSSDKSRVKHVLNFSKSRHLTFQEINESFLTKFISYLRNKSLSERSIVNNLVVIRTIYNRAIKMQIVDRKLYPFGKDKIRIKFPETEKIGLSIEEVQRIERLENLSENENHARNVWLFSFYLAGIRVADVIKIRWSDIFEDRIRYKMNKNSKYLSLKMPEKVFPILEYYIDHKKDKNDFVFPEMKKANLEDAKDIYAKTKTATKKFNTNLSVIAKKAEITKNLTMHIARHSFGNISENKIPIRTLQKLYRHSSITTTMSYQANFINEETDKALDKVVNF